MQRNSFFLFFGPYSSSYSVSFAVLKQFPDHFSSLVLAGAVQAGVADVKAKKVYVYYFVFLFQVGTQTILHLLRLERIF